MNKLLYIDIIHPKSYIVSRNVKTGCWELFVNFNNLLEHNIFIWITISTTIKQQQHYGKTLNCDRMQKSALRKNISHKELEVLKSHKSCRKLSFPRWIYIWTLRKNLCLKAPQYEENKPYVLSWREWYDACKTCLFTFLYKPWKT